jgi:hypothetical protein
MNEQIQFLKFSPFMYPGEFLSAGRGAGMDADNSR